MKNYFCQSSSSRRQEEYLEIEIVEFEQLKIQSKQAKNFVAEPETILCEGC